MTSAAVILGFDFGLKQIGIAVAQEVTRTATPLEIIKAKDGQPDWNRVQSIIDEWKPSSLVVGLPLNMDGSDSPMAVRAKKFAQRLHGRFGLKVDLHDERLTSFEVKQALKDSEATSNVSRKIRKDKIDALAAATILESWLQANL